MGKISGLKMDQYRKYHQQTGIAWDVTAAIYERDETNDLALLRSGGNSLLSVEQRSLQGLNTWCTRAIHLQCAGGTDTLSLWQMGAAEVVGVDISEKMIEVARHKSTALGAPARWVCTDVLDTPHELDGTADLVYTGKGALPWMMDIQAWAGVVARLLKPGGKLYVFEGHPLDWVWDMQADDYQFSAQTGNYFDGLVATDRGWPMFSVAIEEHPNKDQLHVHERQWTLGAILNSLVAAGLQLVCFEEYPDLFWNQFPNLPADLACRLPHTFSLLMQAPNLCPSHHVGEGANIEN
jgi:ubiquinone/menaquinone biosynthesis C-methylase UbiE